jgi:hypothetical protein
MFAMLRIASPTMMFLVLGLIAHTAAPLPADAGGAPGPQVIRADQLTKQQFDQQLKRLPDSAVIESQGRRFTVGEIRARAAQRRREMAAKAPVAARAAQAKVAARQAQFLQQQQAQLQADNVKAMAEFGRLRQARATPQARQVEAIEQEAAQLFQRSQRAAPAERAQIEQRAGQLLQQLQQLGR